MVDFGAEGMEGLLILAEICLLRLADKEGGSSSSVVSCLILTKYRRGGV